MITYYIAYPRGNRNQIAVVEISENCEYEINDYLLASKKSFKEASEAVQYAKKLAKRNELEYIHDSDHPDYLNEPPPDSNSFNSIDGRSRIAHDLREILGLSSASWTRYDSDRAITISAKDGESILHKFDSGNIRQFWIVRYSHRHGDDVWPVFGDTRPSDESIIASLEEEWEGRSDEFIETYGPFTANHFK